MRNLYQRALVIQSGQELSAYTCALLDEIGYRHVIEASDLQQAEKLLRNAVEKNKPFQVIVCDDAISEGALAVYQHAQGIPFLAISDAENPNNLRLAAKLGLAGLIFRPYGKNEFEKALKAVLKS